MLLSNVHYSRAAEKATDTKFKWVSNIVQQLSWSKLTRSQIFHPRELQIQQDCEIGTQPRFVKWICWKRIPESNGILLTS